MAFHAVPKCIGLVVAGVGPAGELRHVMHAISAAEHPTTAELQTAADTLATWCSTLYKLKVSSGNTILSVTAIDESQVDGAQVLGSGGLPVACTLATGGIIPAALSLCVSLQTGFGGRSHRGRFYAWPPTAGELNGNNFTTTYADGLVANLNTLRANMATAAVPLGVKSNVLTAITPVTLFVLRDYTVDTQTRRGAGRGR